MKLLLVGVPVLMFGPNQHGLITVHLVLVCGVDLSGHTAPVESTNGFACWVEPVSGELAERLAVIELLSREIVKPYAAIVIPSGAPIGHRSGCRLCETSRRTSAGAPSRRNHSQQGSATAGQPRACNLRSPAQSIAGTHSDRPSRRE